MPLSSFRSVRVPHSSKETQVCSEFVLVACANNLLECVLKRGTSNEEAVDVWLGNELLGVLVGD